MLQFKKNTLIQTIGCIGLYFALCTNAFAQQYSSSNPQFGWGPWTQNPCYKGIYIRAQKAYFNKSAKQWYWNWQIQNRYDKRVAISWVFYDSTKGKPSQTNARHTFEPKEIWKNGSFGSETELSWLFESACFAFKTVNGTLLDDCSSDPATYGKGYYYAECDNGLPNYQAYNGTTKGTTSIRNQQNTPAPANQNTIYDSHSEVVPAKFNGNLGSFIGQNLKYPEQAAENGVQGRVNLKLIIETDGTISASVIDGPVALRAEALRVVNLTSGNWIPASQNNKRVRYSLTLPITFNLSD
ncbi:energy transducer TonB [Pedobacter sp. KR3-3]|uniref:Energy transducer TonB n=1 Tax=Pedobacter albus TaxID=3113905 RepID=A0ABU7I6H4_9SPHI|nr:energy transducer TonB [Pedobacter sp. KR3-3]MEE1944974.1 energy transducer TonB [Pedobacter sp. KR3-3]